METQKPESIDSNRTRLDSSANGADPNRTIAEGDGVGGGGARLPETIGHYRILRLVGEGGMGSVYLAEQENPHGIVALKVIKPGFANAEMLRRFEQEANALGRLQHPGIAQIYEAGTADSGFGPQPYFAMEFIEGRSLIAFAEQNGLKVRARLELMAKICDAVAHAHQRGLIHRDLKPGNIMVDESGQPKILDFGLARVTDSDTEATRQTDMGQLLGTVPYMSLEQVLANPMELDIRSDVYALGVIAYELLAGKLPYDTNKKALHEIVRTIREDNPVPLSSVDRIYRGDIETIVAKALEKDRARRYASSAELAADIRRYLTDQPIVARPPSTSYQLQKFARRHRALVAGAAAVVLVLAIGVVVSTWQAVRARRAEAEAAEQRDQASSSQRRATQQRDRATAAEELAQKERDRSITAGALAEKERNTAVTQQQRADSEAASAKAVNDFLQNDLLAQASAANQSGPATKPDPDLKVRTALDRAAAKITGKFDKQPDVEAAIRDTIGQTYLDLGLYAEARKQLELALALHKRVEGPDSPKTLNAARNLGFVAEQQGKYAEAEVLDSQTSQAMRRVLGPEHPDTLKTMTRLATVYSSQGKYAQAEALFSQTLEIDRRVLGQDNPETLRCMNNLGVVYVHEGKYAQAEALFGQVVELRRKVSGPEHPDTLRAMNNLGVVYDSQGKYAEAEALQLQLLEINRRVSGPEHPDTLRAMNNLAGVYSAQGKYAQAEVLLSQALEIYRRVLGPEHPGTLLAMKNLGEAYSAHGKYSQAEALFSQTLEVYRRVSGPEHGDTLYTLSDMASMYQRQGKYDLAEKYAAQALAGRRHALGTDNPETMASAADLALVYQSQGKFTESEPLAREAEATEQTKEPDNWLRFWAESLLGASLAGQKKYAEAEPLLLEGYRGMLARKDRIAVPDQRHLDSAREWIVQMYQAWGKPDKAAEWASKGR